MYRKTARKESNNLYGIAYHNGNLYSIEEEDMTKLLSTTSFNDSRHIILKFHQVDNTFKSQIFTQNYPQEDSENPRVRTTVKFKQLHLLACNNEFLYATDYYNYAVHQIRLSDGSIVETFGNGEFDTQNGNASETRFQYPRTITCDTNGNVYVLDYIVRTLRKISREGITSTMTVFTEDAVARSDWYESKLAFDPVRNVLYLTIDVHICIVQLDGKYEIWNTGIKQLRGVAVDRRGTVFVSTASEGIYLANPENRTMELIISPHYFSHPADLAVDETGNLYVVDYLSLSKFSRYPEWKDQRWLWLGFLKHSSTECYIAKLPKEMVKEIIKHLV